ncbi:cell division protein MraZ [Mycoplasmopsis columbinasalis]|uniref:Transcriptional regulator MraZ n=1 Tax=Mycoplasmopsis columbinasalis TaxID=114880 RepID=A0A449BB45_9BACT|nr:cell division protein MraZ [Mycoplasmopsis columbinasalis]
MYGQYERTIDAKNRIILPAKIRDILGSTFFITLGLENVIELRNVEQFHVFASKLNAQSNFDMNARMLKRMWLGSTQEIELDTQGRFVLPKQFIEASAIQKNLVFVGVGDIVELWAKETFDNYQTNLSLEQIRTAAETLAAKEGKNE